MKPAYLTTIANDLLAGLARHTTDSEILTTLPVSSSRVSIADELSRYAGHAKGHDDLETLLDAAVDALLASGNDDKAIEVYSRYSEACIGWRAIGATPDEHSTIAGIGDHSRHAAAGEKHDEYRHAIGLRFGTSTAIGRTGHSDSRPRLAAPRILLTDKPEQAGENAIHLTPSQAYRENHSAARMAAIRPATPRKRRSFAVT